jgi:UDP-2,3-diacylglucosamine pyrophosphatase LpxH
MTHRILILSDLHITAPHPWAAFRDQAALGDCLQHIAQQPPFTLVLAGDTFDFLMLADYDGFDADRSPERLAAILTCAENAPILAGLRAVAAAGHRIALLAGNHDPEVLLPAVRARFAELIGLTTAPIDDDLLHTPVGEAPLWGLRFGPPDAEAWVVHGDHWDAANFIDRAALLHDALAGRPVALPPGSRLVYRVIRRLKGDGYPWVDQVKPEIPAVVPLLLYLDWPLTMSVLKSDWKIGANLLVRALGASGGTLLGGPAASAGTPSELAPFIEALREAMPPDERDALLDELSGAEHFPPPPPPAPGTLADHGGVWRWLLRAWLNSARKQSAGFFDRQGPDDITDTHAPVPPHVAILIAGHTHGPRDQQGATRYLNSGTWTPTWPLPEGDLEDIIDAIERDELPVPEEVTPRTVVELTAGDRVDARLLQWTGTDLAPV